MSNRICIMDLPRTAHAIYTLRHPDVQGLLLKVCFLQFSEGEIPTIVGFHSHDGVRWLHHPDKYDAERPRIPATMEEARAIWHRYRANGWRKEEQ